MRLLIHGINFAPELTGIGKYTGEMAEWFAARGHQLELVTAPPYYPGWKIGAGFSGRRYQTEFWGPAGGVRVTRCPLWVPGRLSGKSRLLHLLSFAISSIPALVLAAARRPDVLMVIVPTLATAPAALVIGWLWRIPVWLHVQDFEVDAMLNMDIVGGGRAIGRFALAIESWLLKRFDRASSISPKMTERLLAKGVAPERVVEFPNWVDLDSIRPIEGPSPMRASLGVNDAQACVLYSGNMGEKQGLEVVLEAARLLADRPDIRFVFCGAGAARERLQRAAAGLDKIDWHPLQPLEKLNELLNAADIHVLPQRAEAADLVMPSKLTGMLASGRAVIGTAFAATGLGQVLDDCGVRVDPGNGAALAEAIAALADDPERRIDLGQRGRAYAELHLARDVILRRIEEQLLALALGQDQSIRKSRSVS
jgi:colanic acid biosynthesis glycosyl transferase WcaI